VASAGGARPSRRSVRSASDPGRALAFATVGVLAFATVGVLAFATAGVLALATAGALTTGGAFRDRRRAPSRAAPTTARERPRARRARP